MTKKPSVENAADKNSKGEKTDARSQALNLAIAQITKSFGDGSIMKLGDAKKIDVQLIPSGSLSLDLALGGGYPKGRIIEIYGPESSGKTTLTLHAIAEIQKQGGTAAFIDAEHALDPAYAKRIGVDTANLLISQAPLTLLSSTLSLPSFHKPKSMATWATPKWAFKLVSCLRPCASSLVSLVSPKPRSSSLTKSA